MKTLDLERVANNATSWKDSIPTMQTAVYVMVGGGMLGRFAAEQPADFYIDNRVGRLPYSRKEVSQAVSILALIAEKNGLNPHDLPPMPSLHNLGIF